MDCVSYSLPLFLSAEALTEEQWWLLVICIWISLPRLRSCGSQVFTAAWKAINSRAISLLKSTYLLRAQCSICKWECLVTSMHTLTHTHIYIGILLLSFKLARAHTHSTSDSSALDENKILSEVLSSAGWTRGDFVLLHHSSVMPLFSSFLFLHFTLAQKQLNKTVFAKLLISWKSLGGLEVHGGLLCFYISVLVQSAAFQLSITIFRPQMKAGTLFSTPPRRISLKVMPVNHTHQSNRRERQQRPCVSTARSHGVFLTERVRRGAAKKNKLQIWSGYLINHDNRVRLNEHFFPDLSLPTGLGSFSQLLRATQRLRQLATKMSGLRARAL